MDSVTGDDAMPSCSSSSSSLSSSSHVLSLILPFSLSPLFLTSPSPPKSFPAVLYFLYLYTSIYLSIRFSPASDIVSSQSWENGSCQQQTPILKFVLQKEKKTLYPRIGSLFHGRTCLSQMFTISTHLCGQATDAIPCAFKKECAR